MNIITRFRSGLLTAIILLSSMGVMAQDGGSSSSSSSTTTTTSSSSGMADGWYMQPWVWIVGGAVFILLLVALLNKNRGGRRGA